MIIFTPMLLYSIAPEGPIREGDTIFSNGAHKVVLFEPDRYRQVGYEATCMLDPKDPLLVTHPPSEDESGEVIIAQVQGKRTSGRFARLKPNYASNDITSLSNPASFKTYATDCCACSPLHNERGLSTGATS
ncbi:MAG TPA: hypothetical protein PLT27_14435 [Nitrospira sp.]|nr:hypothetical protein [Nitrospira sp.]